MKISHSSSPVRSLVAMIVAFFAVSSAQAHELGLAKAAELALHRIDRLVVLKKIEDGYQKKIAGLEVKGLPHNSDAEPAFVVTAAQVAAADGSQRKLELTLDGDGRELTHKEIAGGAPANAPRWPERAPLILAETSLHYVLDHADDADVAPFFDDMTRLTVGQEVNNGAVTGVMDIEATPSDPILRVKVKADGTLLSTEIRKRAE